LRRPGVLIMVAFAQRTAMLRVVRVESCGEQLLTAAGVVIGDGCRGGACRDGAAAGCIGDDVSAKGVMAVAVVAALGGRAALLVGVDGVP
jgi:hypothetical protein